MNHQLPTTNHQPRTTYQRGFSRIIILPLLVAAIALSVFLVQQRTNLLPKAQERVDTGVCRDNPDVAKRAVDDLNNAQTGNQNFYYKWIAFCSISCSQNSDCPQNNDDPDRINPSSSNWCYGFGDGTNKCLKLIAIDKATNQPAQTSTGRNPATGATFSPGPSESTTTGTKDIGKSCDKGSECKSGTCTNNKCASSNTNNTTNNTTNNSWVEVGQSRCIQACGSSFPTTGKCYFHQSRNLYNCSRAIGSICENDTWCDSGFCDPSKKTCQTRPAGGTSNTTNGEKGTLTKAEITGFKTNFDALYGVLGTSKDSGNLKIVSTTAKEELDSIVSELTKCPDDANVSRCLNKNFGKRFSLAKTAGRLSAFYAIFNGVGGICVKSDFGLNPLINASSQTGVNGRVALCTDAKSQKVWKIFSGGAFSPIATSQTQFPANPTCAALPSDVTTHLQDAEKLFRKEEGFTQNTQCDGKTP